MSVSVRIVPSPDFPDVLTDVVVETHQLSSEFLPAVHDDPDLRTHALVDELCSNLVMNRHLVGQRRT